MKFELIDITVLLPQSMKVLKVANQLNQLLINCLSKNIHQLMIIFSCFTYETIKQMISYSYGARFGVMEVASGWHCGCEMRYHLT